MKTHIKSALAIGLVTFAVATAQANSINGLVNTGSGITADKATDFNYQLTDGAGNSIFGGFGEAAVGAGWPISPWLADNSTSHWLTPTDNRAQSYDQSRNGFYLWTLAFDLSGFDSSTASLSGRFSADNNAIAYLNGSIIGSAVGFSQWYNFAAASHLFVAGINTLEFLVTNLKLSGGNPTGLRVEFTDSHVSAVPLPGALWLFILGLFGLLAIKRTSVNF